jgi:hypothetical protein
MIPIRDSPATVPNEQLARTTPQTGQSNVAWLRSGRLRQGVLLLGGASTTDFRLRVAQSGLRSDLSPSYWSMCGLLIDGAGTFLTVPLQLGDIETVPTTNAVRRCSLDDFDDPVAWPNIAILRFTREMGDVERFARLVGVRRTIVDLPALVLEWLRYAWLVTGADNPLLGGMGIPGAVFVETAHALAGVELTPGLASAASCPEAIWQAVKWWQDYYREAAAVEGGGGARPVVPHGRFAVRQRYAQIVETSTGTQPAATPGGPRRSTRKRA